MEAEQDFGRGHAEIISADFGHAALTSLQFVSFATKYIVFYAINTRAIGAFYSLFGQNRRFFADS
jgi:hypothetical protein